MINRDMVSHLVSAANHFVGEASLGNADKVTITAAPKAESGNPHSPPLFSIKMQYSMNDAVTLEVTVTQR